MQTGALKSPSRAAPLESLSAVLKRRAGKPKADYIKTLAELTSAQA